ncbi:hypothetical protein BGZ57DRAFT_432187 [Hyaloscypha finlandica]|nr:hypothetical protein BGZ57DRAFT_432187 [Hyaloscypha finlandica]
MFVVELVFIPGIPGVSVSKRCSPYPIQGRNSSIQSWRKFSQPKIYHAHSIVPNRPIILDESYPSPDTAALHEEGYEGALVARADSSERILSMSSYGKPDS